jgi:hypothetical protein
MRPFLAVREALLGYYFPSIHHLMCYFHVEQDCQVKVRGKPMKEQKDILHDIEMNYTQ